MLTAALVEWGCPATGAAAMPGAFPGAEEENAPLYLTIYIIDEAIAPMGQGDIPGADEPTILQASTILLNEAVLDAIDPHASGASVEEVPIVRVELFSDLVVDVEFLNATPRWKAGQIDYDENGTPTSVEVLPDGFLIRGKLLEPHSGYIVLRARSGGISIGAVSVDGLGYVQLLRAGVPMHRATLLEHPPISCGLDTETLAQEAMNGFAAMGGGNDDGVVDDDDLDILLENWG